MYVCVLVCLCVADIQHTYIHIPLISLGPWRMWIKMADCHKMSSVLPCISLRRQGRDSHSQSLYLKNSYHHLVHYMHIHVHMGTLSIMYDVCIYSTSRFAHVQIVLSVQSAWWVELLNECVIMGT